MKRLFIIVIVTMLSGIASAQTPSPETITPEPTPTVDMTAVSVQSTELVNAYIEIDNETPFIGDPFTLTFIIDTAPGVTITAWPALPQDDPDVEIIDAPEYTETETTSGTQYRQDLTVRLWRTGAYITPEIPVLYETSGGAIGAAPVQSANLNVTSVLDQSPERELRPASSTIDLPYTSPAIYVVAILIVTTLLWLLLRLFGGTIRRTRQLAQATPAQIAIARLKDLDLQSLPAIVALPLAADALRVYISEKFSVPATEQTTAELLQSLSDMLPSPRRQQLSQILNQADLAKFAKHQPNSEMMQKIIDFAIRWIQGVDTIIVTESSPEGQVADE